MKEKNEIAIKLSFKRDKCFQSIASGAARSISRATSKTLLSLSLGLINSKLGLKKSAKKNKQSFIRASQFLRRCLLCLSRITLNINIKGDPKYIKDILNTVFSSTSNIVINPLNDNYMSNNLINNETLSINEIAYNSNKGYKDFKKKKKGSIKRKIMKKIMKTNNVID
jgi:hypothetical protein